MQLDRNHRLDVGQNFGRLPENPGADFKVPDKTWIAVIVDNTTGRSVVKSEPSTTRNQAIDDAERKYAARSSR
jgi:hypothetical protein